MAFAKGNTPYQPKTGADLIELLRTLALKETISQETRDNADFRRRQAKGRAAALRAQIADFFYNNSTAADK